MIREQQSRRRRLVTGLCGAILLTQVARTMAEDVLPSDPIVTQALVQTPVPSHSPAPIPSSASEVAVTASAQVAPKVAHAVSVLAANVPIVLPTPKRIPPQALTNQSLAVQVPNRIAVDPRARSIQLPRIAVFGSRYVLACLNSADTTFEISQPDTSSSTPLDGALVAGNGTTELEVSGTRGQVMAALNTSNGLWLYSVGNGIAGHSARFTFVALTEPSVNPALCDEFSVSNSRTIYFLPLGINLDMVNGNVTLKH